MTSNSGRGFTAEEVEDLHRQAFVRGPWFSTAQCEGLAIIFNNVFLPPAAEANEVIRSADGTSLSSSSDEAWKRRRAAFKLLMEVATLPSPNHYWCDPCEGLAMAGLRTALENAERYVAPRWTKIRPWAAVTIVLAAVIAQTMKEVGYEQIPTSRNSRLAHFLELLLPSFVEDPPQREAIGAFLNEKGSNGQSTAALLAHE